MTIRDFRDSPSIDRFDSSEEAEANPKYRTAGKDAVAPEEILNVLDRIETAVQTPPSDYDEGDSLCSVVTTLASDLQTRISEGGIIEDDYEWEMSRMRELIEDASRYMSVGNFRQNVPQNVIKHFKDTMKRMNAILARNKGDRQNDGRKD